MMPLAHLGPFQQTVLGARARSQHELASRGASYQVHAPAELAHSPCRLLIYCPRAASGVKSCWGFARHLYTGTECENIHLLLFGMAFLTTAGMTMARGFTLPKFSNCRFHLLHPFQALKQLQPDSAGEKGVAEKAKSLRK